MSISKTRAVLRAAYYQGIRLQLLPSHKAQPFIIVGAPRTGSTFLQTLLDSHPNVVCMHELYRPHAGTPAFFRHYVGQRRSLLKMRNADPPRFLETVFHSNQAPWIHAVGFKALYTHPDPDDWDAAWTAMGQIENLRAIYLLRNPIRSAVSSQVARQSRAWMDRKSKEPISIDAAWLVRYLERLERLEAAARNALANVETLELNYRDLASETERNMNAVCDFLGVESRSLVSKRRKQNPQGLGELVANYDEICASLVGTRWENELELADKELAT